MKLSKSKKYLFFWLMVSSLLLISCESKTQDILNINLKDHQGLAVHIHPTLEISILGEKRAIPSDLGRYDLFMRVVHAHDDSGKLHLESPYPHQFYLGDVFAIWNRTFSDNCIFEYCANADHTLKVYLNGLEDPRYSSIPLRDLDEIKIVYEKK